VKGKKRKKDVEMFWEKGEVFCEKGEGSILGKNCEYEKKLRI
jgi:hypothetical protein